ncbi:MAG TPA: PstS family phosphate ABC transporter substrate-binding protein [Acidimicrobiales bacterium]|nr:PstS family phosphate ABC transporter substrate-binding protein [Acidimicrobiales bacterium]
MKRRMRGSRAAALALAAGLALAGCGGEGGSDDGDGASGEGGLSGSISIDGSSTVAPISEAIAEEFRSVEPGVQVTVETSGTGGGFKRFCAGETDVSDASRPIKAEEEQACAAAGVDYTELRVGLDGLAIVTSADNDFLECLSLGQLATIFKEGGAATWDQVDPSFPKEKVDIFAPGTDSGTYDFFVEEVLGAPGEADSVKPRSDYTASEDDNTLVQGIAGQKNSWGYFGFAYYSENAAKLKDLGVSEDDGGECVKPSDETVESGDYVLSRPLFIYVKNESLARPEVAAFARFYLETTPDIIGDVGYTAAPAEDYDEGLDAVEAAAG